MICQVSGLLFRAQNWSKMGSESHIEAEDVRKPLDRPLDGSWRGLEGSWSALGGLLERPTGRDHPKTGSRRAQGEIRQIPGRGRGGVFNPLPLG